MRKVVWTDAEQTTNPLQSNDNLSQWLTTLDEREAAARSRDITALSQQGCFVGTFSFLIYSKCKQITVIFLMVEVKSLRGEKLAPELLILIIPTPCSVNSFAFLVQYVGLRINTVYHSKHSDISFYHI